MARAIIEAAPDRVIWGSDWPHIPEGGRDTGALSESAGRLGAGREDARANSRSNPARLFGFAAGSPYP